MSKSELLFNDAKKILVGGVNSPVRAFSAVGGTPLFIKKAKGAYLTCEDNKQYIDYVQSWGPMIFGHAEDEIVEAIHQAASLGISFGAPTKVETECAKLIHDFYPSMEKVRFVSSGTEATMSAIRLARGVTNRPYIVKFKGCYHGHSDSLLVESGSGGLTFGEPNSAGVLEDTAKYTYVLDYNDTKGIESLFKHHGSTIAGVIIEPITGNMGVIKPLSEFLSKVRDCCSEHNALLIFDEVMCGFRASQGSVSHLLGIEPDITVLGKVIGGGVPCGAYGASKAIMSHISPEGSVYQAGTLSGNPLAMAAGIATLKKLTNKNVFEYVNKITTTLVQEITHIINDTGINAQVSQVGSMWTVFFKKGTILNCEDVKRCDMKAFSTFFHAMLKEGVYLPPSQFEAGFVSAAHTEKEIEQTIKACKKTMLGMLRK